MKTIKKITAALCSLMMLPLGACVTPSPNSSESTIETSPSASTTDSIETSSAPETSSNGDLPAIDLDHMKQHDNVERISNFNYYDFVDDGQSYLKLVAVIDDVVYLEKNTQKTENTADIYYYQYNLSTGESEKFDGCVADWNASVDSYALVGDCIFFTIETLGEQVHYKVDLTAKTVTPLKSRPWNLDYSFVYTYPIDETSYIETYFDIDRDMLTYHVTLFTPEGEREIITKSGDRNEDIYFYSASGGKIYECSQRNHLSEVYVTTYDTNGEQVSSKFLQNVSDACQAEPDSFWEQIVPFGNYIAFNLGYEATRNTCLLYDVANDKVSSMGDIQFTPYTQSSVSNGVQTVITNAKSGDPALMNLCFIDQTGSLTKLVGNLAYTYSVVNNEDVIVILNGVQLYRATL